MSPPEKLKRKLLTSDAEGDRQIDERTGVTIYYMPFPPFFECKDIKSFRMVLQKEKIYRDKNYQSYRKLKRLSSTVIDS